MLDITAVRIASGFGTATIFNIYNDCKHDDSTDVLRGCLACNQDNLVSSTDDYMLWAGDFNRHHPLWDSKNNGHLFMAAANRAAQVIINLAVDYGMSMLLPRGINTLRAHRTGNWTRPDNVFGSSNMEDALVRCEADPRNQGPCADHIPVLTVLDLPTRKRAVEPTRNFRNTNWTEFEEDLTARMCRADFPEAQPIGTEEEFQEMARRLTKVIQETIEAKVPMTNPSRHMKRWWSEELDDARRQLNKLSEKAHRHRALDDYSLEEELLLEQGKYAKAMQDAQTKHWEDFLDQATERELWVANRYATKPATDGGQTRVPTLEYKDVDGNTREATTNQEKCELFESTLFPPPPPATTVPRSSGYPTPLLTSGLITREQIRRSIARLSPYKACGEDGIPNIVLKKVYHIIEDHLLYLF